MSRNYYYLIAGLPDIALDETKKLTPLDEFISDISEKIDPQDAALLRVLRYPFDNHNLCALLEKREESFDPRGNYSIDEMEQEIKLPEHLPEYMKTFLEAHKEEKPLHPILTIEDQLSWLFYEEMTQHENQFYRQWFTFDLNLRNVLAGLNCRQFSQQHDPSTEQFTLSRKILLRNETAESILKSSAPDFSLTQQNPWVERIVSSSQASLVELEKNIDLLRWEMLDILTTFSYFHIETILSFCIKLRMVERWQELEPDSGKEKLETLLAELNTEYEIAKEFS